MQSLYVTDKNYIHNTRYSKADRILKQAYLEFHTFKISEINEYSEKTPKILILKRIH